VQLANEAAKVEAQGAAQAPDLMRYRWPPPADLNEET